MRVQSISAFNTINRSQNINKKEDVSFKAKIYEDWSYDRAQLEKLGKESGRPYEVVTCGYEKSYGQIYELYIEEKKDYTPIDSRDRNYLERLGKESGRPYHIGLGGYEKTYGQMYILYFDDKPKEQK